MPGRPPDKPPVDPHAFVIQSAIAVPVILGMVLYTLTRWDRTPLHRMIVGLLASLIPWLVGIVLKLTAGDPDWRLFGLHLEQLAVIAMPPLFLLAMGQFARVAALEPGRPLFAVVVTLPAVITVLYLSNAWHGLFYTDIARALAGAHPREWGGPIYWSGQGMAAIFSWSALACLAVSVWRGRTPAEKRRSLMVLGAVFLPCVAHLAYLTGLQPFRESLVPLTLGLTAVLFVYGVEAYGVLEAQPIVRNDVIEHLRDALVIAAPSGVVLDANAAAEATLGCARRALRGRPLEEVLALITAPEDAHALGERIAGLAPGDAHAGGEIVARDGRSFELTIASVKAKGSQPAGVFVSLRDRTAQRRNERLLRERQKLESVGILAAGVAHEVNNPLAFVRANLVHLRSLATEVEKVVRPDDEGLAAALLEMPEIVDESLEGIARIGRIVESMLRFSRAPEELMRPVDLNEIVAESMRLADLHRDRSVQVQSALRPGLPRVMGSADRLVQVLLNLFLNGKQALSGIPNARIVAQTGLDDGAAVVRVSDNGPGIPAADLQHIFDPFFTTRGPDEGTGLGLSIAFDIVREHGGLLEVESEVGTGTCFTLRLPLAGT